MFEILVSDDQIGPAIEAAVQQGIALLDAKIPGWVDRIDLGHFDLGNCQRCVLGQLFGDYSVGLYRLTRERNDEATWIWAVERGFAAPRLSIFLQGSARVDTVYDQLTAVWKREILARRQK